nr:immunoglobulin heavy chain junction region [Macaca mulatta]
CARGGSAPTAIPGALEHW